MHQVVDASEQQPFAAPQPAHEGMLQRLHSENDDLMQKIAIRRDAALTARYPEGIPNRLEVTTA